MTNEIAEQWIQIENQPTHACKTAMLVPFQPGIVDYIG